MRDGRGMAMRSMLDFGDVIRCAFSQVWSGSQRTLVPEQRLDVSIFFVRCPMSNNGHTTFLHSPHPGVTFTI